MAFFNVGDKVKHFKYETLTEEQKNNGVYTYQILAIATHTENKEKLMIYKALYDGHCMGLDVSEGEVFARPYDMFISEVDHVKYPNIKQRFRFEKI